MVSGGYREEVFNVLLALLLHQRGIVAAPEQSFREAVQRRRSVPDVLVVFHGLRTVIEGKVDDTPDATGKVLADAQERVDKGIAHIGLAVLYPAALRQAPFEKLLEALAQSTFRIAVCSEAGQTGWTEGNLDYLGDLLHRTFRQLVQEDTLNKAVETLDAGVTQFARAAFTTPTTVQRAAEILGVGEPARRSRRQEEGEE
ncbi:MAG: hypothetical protein HY683_04745 [Chloroflexi bacterium]|nr:hypothetical protein [Chloroflexota bacterium]